MSDAWPVVLSDDDGIRPAGPPDGCFYCKAKVGQEHQRDCVIVKKVIKARYTFEVPTMIPWFWGPEDFESHRNESSSCSNNIVTFDLAQAVGRDGCLCQFATSEWIEEVDTTPRRLTQAESREDNKLVRSWELRADE
jgi:hypothetical protein